MSFDLNNIFNISQYVVYFCAENELCVFVIMFSLKPKCVFCWSGQKRNMKKFPPAWLNQPSSQCDCSIGSWCAGLWLSGLLSCNLSANQSSLPSQSSSHCQALLLTPSPSGDPPLFGVGGYFACYYFCHVRVFVCLQCPLSLPCEFTF